MYNMNNRAPCFSNYDLKDINMSQEKAGRVFSLLVLIDYMIISVVGLVIPISQCSQGIRCFYHKISARSYSSYVSAIAWSLFWKERLIEYLCELRLEFIMRMSVFYIFVTCCVIFTLMYMNVIDRTFSRSISNVASSISFLKVQFRANTGSIILNPILTLFLK